MKNRIILIGTILFVLLFAFIGYSQERQRDKMQMRDHFADELNLTEEQQNRIDELRLQHQKSMVDLKADLQKKKIEQKELMQKGNYTRAGFLENTNSIITAENQVELARANHQMDIYEQLDENQKAVWNKKGFGMHDKREKFKRMKHKGFDVD